MKKKTDFLEEMKNSEQFLNKLNNFKKASKQIKDKNKLISHRNIWVKQYKYLARLQRDHQIDNINYFEIFDKYFGFEMEERQIFGKEDYKSFSQYLKTTEEQFSHYEFSIQKQFKQLPFLVSKLKEKLGDSTDREKNMKQAQKMLFRLGKTINQEQKNLNVQFDKIQKSQMTVSKIMAFGQGQENQQQYDFLQELLVQHNFDDVKGFDFETNQIRRIQQGQHHLKQYIQSLSDRLSQDQISSVINEYNHASNLLNQTLQLELQKIALDYEDALSLDPGLLSMSQNFQIINHIYSAYLGRGKSQTLYSERLGIEFPHVSRKVLQRVTQYIQGKIYKSRKSNAAKRNFLRQRQQLLQKVQKEVNERIENKIKKAQKEAQKLQRKEQKLKLQKELEHLRAEYQKRKSEKEKQIQEQDQKQKQQQRKRDAIRKLYLDELSKKAAELQEVKEKKLKQEQERKRKEKQEQISKLKKEIQQNKGKVEERQYYQIKKIQRKLEEGKEKRELPVKNQERINKAIEKYSFRPTVQASEQRLNAPTQGMIKRKQILYDKADKIELTKMTGYNINQLMNDRRFKLNTALFEAGLANTDYARQVLNKMSKPQNS